MSDNHNPLSGLHYFEEEMAKARLVCFPGRDDITHKDMCEVIEKAKILRKGNGEYPTAKEIWEYSPTGELSQIAFWFIYAARALYGNAEE